MTTLNNARRALLELEEVGHTKKYIADRLSVIGAYLDAQVALNVESPSDIVTLFVDKQAMHPHLGDRRYYTMGGGGGVPGGDLGGGKSGSGGRGVTHAPWCAGYTHGAAGECTCGARRA